jgi:hypothetical protein
MKTPTSIPTSINQHASVTALAGAVTVVLIWAVGFAGLPVPAEVASAFTTIVAAMILWASRLEQKLMAAASAQA